MNTNLFKATELRLIAFKCGVATTGTKAVLRSHINQALTSLSPPPIKPRRILSIDVGIRNLAYCILDTAINRLQTPSIHAWQCLPMSTASVVPSLLVSTDPPPPPLLKESFDPTTLSRAAYSLLREKLLLYNPTHVLIERQRFRSHRAKCVLEWTLRVNLLEAILHAVLHTLRAEGAWTGEVEMISPKRVNLLWLGGEIELKSNKSKNAQYKNKRKKIALVRGWLENGTTNITLGNDSVNNIAKGYVKKRKSRAAKPKNDEPDENSILKLGKLDDLTDALLQGLAWLCWENNKRMAVELGVETLLDT